MWYYNLDISSANIDTHVPSLDQYVGIFWLLSQPFPRLRFNLFHMSETFTTQMLTALRDKQFLL
jgi:hypothetical protein